MFTWKRRLKELEAVKVASFPLIVRPSGERFIIEAPPGLAGRTVTQRWLDASGADPTIIDNIPDNPVER